MGFELKLVNDNWEVVLIDEPKYIHALKMAPEMMEAELGRGTWMIVVFPVWSAPVRQSVRAALVCAKQHAGKFHLGIRPYDYHDEISKWWPEIGVPTEGKTTISEIKDGHHVELHIATDTSNDPAWLILKEGQVVHQGTGPRSAEQLGEMIHDIII